MRSWYIRLVATEEFRSLNRYRRWAVNGIGQSIVQSCAEYERLAPAAVGQTVGPQGAETHLPAGLRLFSEADISG